MTGTLGAQCLGRLVVRHRREDGLERPTPRKRNFAEMVPEADSWRREGSAAQIKAYDLTIAGGCPTITMAIRRADCRTGSFGGTTTVSRAAAWSSTTFSRGWRERYIVPFRLSRSGDRLQLLLTRNKCSERCLARYARFALAPIATGIFGSRRPTSVVGPPTKLPRP
jgi:hypothetical protein